LQRVSLSINEGEFLGLIGPNGSGKTTLIGVILGLVTPTSGSVEIFGAPPSPRNLRRVGYVPQKAIASDLNFPSTAFETVLMGRTSIAGPLRRFNEDDRRKVDEVLEQLHISNLRNRRIGELSGGQSQRVFLAKALAGEPDLLILDEPTSGVDTKSSSEFYEILERLNRERRTTVILASHDISVITHLSSRIVCLNGLLCFHGTVPEFLKSSVLTEVYGYPVELITHDIHG
jgi:zinc transport system ATP-binding protein